MSSVRDYFSGMGKGLVSLLKGMEVTGKEFLTPKVTEQYPDNRANLNIGKRFRGTLAFIYDDEGNHKCIACGLCQMNCPNGTITIMKKQVELPDGKKKMKLDKYMYDLGSCTFCQLCVESCPHHAIHFLTDFEHAVFTRSKLVKQLNYLPEKEIEVKPVAPKPAPAAAPAATPTAATATAETAKPSAEAVATGREQSKPETNEKSEQK